MRAELYLHDLALPVRGGFLEWRDRLQFLLAMRRTNYILKYVFPSNPLGLLLPCFDDCSGLFLYFGRFFGGFGGLCCQLFCSFLDLLHILLGFFFDCVGDIFRCFFHLL